MNTKQQLATGFLALVIVSSIAFMPVSAEEKSAAAPVPHAQGAIAAPQTVAELPQDPARDLTYN
jgi:hypothetical protein